MHSGRSRQTDEEQHPHDRSKNSGTQTMENTRVHHIPLPWKAN